MPACVRLPTFQHHHHLLLLRTAGHHLLLLLCGAAGRRIVSLEQLVHLPLHLWRVALAVALGDGEPLAHGGRRQSRFLFRRDETGEGGEENFGSACVTGLVVSSADRAEPLVRFLCREIRCVIPTGPSHQPVSARRLQRVWVLEPITARTNQIKIKYIPIFDKNFNQKWSLLLSVFQAALVSRIIGFITLYHCCNLLYSFKIIWFRLNGAAHCSPYSKGFCVGERQNTQIKQTPLQKQIRGGGALDFFFFFFLPTFLTYTYLPQAERRLCGPSYCNIIFSH